MNNVDTIISDIRTFNILKNNDNYRERLHEAYTYLKSEGINSLEDFLSRKGLLIGAFTYDEITIFDRIKDESYYHSLETSLGTINNQMNEYVNDPHIGDRLASFGKLGKTPYREELIRNGYVVDGLTKEEANKHYR